MSKIVNIQARVGGALLERIDDWRRMRQKIPARAEAMRDLITRGLEMEEPPRGRGGSFASVGEPGGDASALEPSRVGGSIPPHSTNADDGNGINQSVRK